MSTTNTAFRTKPAKCYTPPAAPQKNTTPPPAEPDGMAAVAQGVAQQRFPHTADARAWVVEWMTATKDRPDIASDEDTMLGWFANAIMAGYDNAASHIKTNQNDIESKYYELLYCLNGKTGLDRHETAKQILEAHENQTHEPMKAAQNTPEAIEGLECIEEVDCRFT